MVASEVCSLTPSHLTLVESTGSTIGSFCVVKTISWPSHSMGEAGEALILAVQPRSCLEQVEISFRCLTG